MLPFWVSKVLSAGSYAVPWIWSANELPPRHVSKQILRRIALSGNHVFYLPVSMQNLYATGSKFIHLFRSSQRNQNHLLPFFCPSPNEIWANTMFSEPENQCRTKLRWGLHFRKAGVISAQISDFLNTQTCQNILSPLLCVSILRNSIFGIYFR